MGQKVGSSALFFSGQGAGLPSSREAEISARLSPPDLHPFLSKLLGKTSKLQFFLVNYEFFLVNYEETAQNAY